jgi:hypothetical protein
MTCLQQLTPVNAPALPERITQQHKMQARRRNKLTERADKKE